MKRAMTLIEVVAALALLGTLLVTLLQTHTSASRQVAAARKKLGACDAADVLLANWWGSPGGIPINAVGTAGEWRWRTTAIADASADALHSRVIRLQLFPTGSAEPAASIDLLQAKTGVRP